MCNNIIFHTREGAQNDGNVSADKKKMHIVLFSVSTPIVVVLSQAGLDIELIFALLFWVNFGNKITDLTTCATLFRFLMMRAEPTKNPY